MVKKSPQGENETAAGGRVGSKNSGDSAALRYPAETITAAAKTAFLYRLQERLRLEHNKMGDKARFMTISKQEWDEFLRSWSEKSEKVVSEILAARAQLKADDGWNIDLEAAFEPQEE